MKIGNHSIEVLPAGYGDSIFLSLMRDRREYNILIDGGLAKTYFDAKNKKRQKTYAENKNTNRFPCIIPYLLHRCFETVFPYLHRLSDFIIAQNLRDVNLSHHNHSEGMYISKPQVKCTLARDEIQGRRVTLDDMHRTSYGDDMPSLRLG